MTFREMSLGDELNISAVETNKSVFHSVIATQSPVMKFWFVVMAVNLAMFFFIIR